MGIFNKEKKEIDIALNYLNQLLIDYVTEWEKILEWNLSAKATSELPIERVEPQARKLWVECYARSILMKVVVEMRYKQVCEKTPAVAEIITFAHLETSINNQGRRMGEILGEVIRKITEFTPGHKKALELHLEQPQLGAIQEESRIRAVELLKESQL